MNAITQGNGASTAYNAQQMRFLGIPSAEALPENQFYHQAAAVCEAKTSVNTDNRLTPQQGRKSEVVASQYNNLAPIKFKRKAGQEDDGGSSERSEGGVYPLDSSDSDSHGSNEGISEEDSGDRKIQAQQQQQRQTASTPNGGTGSSRTTPVWR